MEAREQRGLELADAAKISRNGKGWVVPSQGGKGRYILNLLASLWSKGEFGAAMRSKSDVGHVSEVLAKTPYHNICVLVLPMHELGIEPAFFDQWRLRREPAIAVP